METHITIINKTTEWKKLCQRNVKVKKLLLKFCFINNLHIYRVVTYDLNYYDKTKTKITFSFTPSSSKGINARCK